MVANKEQKTYKDKLREAYANERSCMNNISEETKYSVRNLKAEFGVEDKSYPTNEDILIILLDVLETGCKARDAANKYALEKNKPEKWVSDILDVKAKPYITYCLDKLESNHTIVTMRKNGLLNKRDIYKCRVSGAINKIRTLKSISDEIESLRCKVMLLEEALKAKVDSNDWETQAIELKQEGLSCREIATRTGKSKSTIHSFLQREVI